VTVREAGKVVAEIHVDSFTELSTADPTLFAVTKEMTWAVTTQPSQKMSVFPGKGSVAPDATIQPVCVFGVITPSGELVEAHSLQPSDPNSKAALEYAKTMSFRAPVTPAGGPEQHFVFIIEKFAVSGLKPTPH
jgi:hypothetical protein